jgi:hypothetical protein
MTKESMHDSAWSSIDGEGKDGGSNGNVYRELEYRD